MHVTSVDAIGRNRCKICIEETTPFVLHQSEVEQYDIRADQELSRDAFDEIFEELLWPRAQARCVNLLKASDRTERVLCDKLRQDGYPDPIIERALEYVTAYDYVNDERFARRYIEQKKQSKSFRQMEHELLAKGISKNTIWQILEEQDDSCEEEAIRRLLRKKNIDPQTASRHDLQGFYTFLYRRGFSHDEISKVLFIKT